MQFLFRADAEEGAVKSSTAHRVLVLDGGRGPDGDSLGSVFEEKGEDITQLVPEHCRDGERRELQADRAELLFIQRPTRAQRAGQLRRGEGQVVKVRGGSAAQGKTLRNRETFTDQSGQTDGFAAEFSRASRGESA